MDDMKDKIRDALMMMDSMDDEQWTTDGAPKVDKVAELGEIENLKRADIIDAAPKFSRENFDISEAEPEEEQPEVEAEEENTEGYNHPEIVAAQEAYDKSVADLAKAKEAEAEAGRVLNEVTNRLMKQTYDRQANQRHIMDAINASNASRAARVADFNANKALLTGKPPRSPLDEAKATEKKVRPKM